MNDERGCINCLGVSIVLYYQQEIKRVLCNFDLVKTFDANKNIQISQKENETKKYQIISTGPMSHISAYLRRLTNKRIGHTVIEKDARTNS